MKNPKMTLKEKLEKSLNLKRENLLKKRQKIDELYKDEILEVNEKIEVIELQLSGLKK
tara:strand:+ start:2834 stop:3007 length:174 start_codon:yes stop_codon:yes gene_type:complete